MTVLPRGDQDEVTLWGDLLGPNPMVRLDGAEQPAGQVTVLSGTMLKVLVPTGSEGEIEVETDLGRSEPVRLDRPDPRSILVP